ncbi:hypothetical protein [Flavobacterium anhuiense]|uniref:hypothetical protein n=1 Tax=Flavobacterium anhuiense TaxID=459526 RepID=UPI000E6C671A|nr:hypothetical protein [Flavobacterium anhuiense]
MKNILFTLILATAFCNAQTALYNKIEKEGKFTEYQTKSGNIVKIGDTLNIGYPRAGNQYSFISQANIPAGTVIANTKVIVSTIKTIGNKKRGFKTYILFKEYGAYPVYIEYESALETGEIKNPFE